jgi:DNA-binding winged helix-turn-helix (wHTH) protein
MDVVYLINDAIYFYPDKNKLICGKEAEQEVSLTQPATKCLELLLKTDGLVSQKNIYDYAWGDNSQNVSPNTLYQNISLIRRALKKFMPGAERWVITVPRHGFRFDHTISVMIVPPPDEKEIVKTERATIYKCFTDKKPFRPLLFILACFLVLTFTSLTGSAKTNFHTLATSYYKTKNQGECHFYIYKNSDEIKDTISHTISRLINCEDYPHIYVSHHHLVKSISLFSCRNPLTHAHSTCASWKLKEEI